MLPHLKKSLRFTERRSLSVRTNLNEHNLFDEIPQRDYKSNNSAIKTFTANKQHTESVTTFKSMQSSCQVPDSFALAAAIKSSSAFSNPSLGKSLHGFAEKMGFTINAIVAKSLMHMYARFNMLDDSCRVFDDMGQRDSVSWNVLITGFARAHMYNEAMGLFYMMHTFNDEGVQPTDISVAVLLPICAKLRFLKHGQSLHCHCIKRGLEGETLIGNALASMYAKCGRVMDDARVSFELIGDKDVVSWNSLIAGCSENGLFDEAFELFYEMVLNGFIPNYATIVNVLPICGFVDNGWLYGREIHSFVLRFGLEVDVSVCNALLSHYSKVGDTKEVESIFKNMCIRDTVTWNTVIAGYASNGWLSKAMDLFHDMNSSGIRPDSVTLVSIIPICAQLLDIKEGQRIHDYILQHSMLSQETSLWNALISFYGKCGELDAALDIFKEMQKKDLISWNAMLNAFLDNDQWMKLLTLFNQMINNGIKPDSITLTSVLPACASMEMRKVREVHGYAFRAGLSTQQTVGNAVLDAYAKCGSIENASKTFENLVERNIVTNNTMISGYMKNGYQEDAEKIFNHMLDRDQTTWNLMLQVYAQSESNNNSAFSLFRELQEKGMKPNTVSIMSILGVCTQLASIRLVRQIHAYTIRASLDDLHVKGNLLDTYSKCGSIKDASKFFQTCHEKDLIIFTAMVGGFAMHGMAKEAINIFSEMLQFGIKPDHVILTTLLSACSHGGLVDEGLKHFKSIKDIHDIEPTMEHYACAVDLLSRRGRLKEAHDFIMDMPYEANANIWSTLLGSCKTHGEVNIGRIAAEKLLDVEDANVGNFVVMSNMYAADRNWDGVEKVRMMMKNKDLKKPAGCSWIEVEKMRHVFVAGDLAHPQRALIYETLTSLTQQIKVQPSQRHFLL
ncbi:putative pentatricopeptide repeat-containing protein At5g08490 [Asparagus officinalis]|uniref:putative pentatricopeptide repeat-containing protein At5g08490 n=1 Tax=Asparagus officinalis TaxID=4686 RepID=UPI00098E6B85|nr:putative pentatricopeptide repeat-containing protein At5g08490 [Asparagus officinalis]